MSGNTEHIFCGLITADGTPVNAIRTYDNRKISVLKNSGLYSRVDNSKLNHLWKDCVVYLKDDQRY